MTGKIIDISSPGTKLSIKHQQLIVQIKGQEDNIIPLEDIGLIIINHPAVILTHAVITRLAKHKAALISCDTDQMPISLTLPFSANQLQGERLRAQMNMSKPFQKRLWQQIIQTKIRLQGEVLSRINGTSFGLDQMARRVQSGDKTNLEAQAAQRYWPRLFGPSFRRERTGAYPNFLLNFGYAIIRSATARSLSMSGLHAGIGVFHHNRSNSFPLADDMMEIWRPFIDLRIKKITKNAQEEHNALSPALKAEILSVMNMAVPIGSEKLPLDLAIQRCSASLAKSIFHQKIDLNLPSSLSVGQMEMTM